MDIYICKEGYIKLEKEEFHIENNDNFNKINKKKIKTEISFETFQKDLDKILKKEKREIINFKKEILLKIKKIILITMESIKYIINENERKNCFELFNYNFIIDQNFIPYLTKINSTFGIEENMFFKKYIFRMYDDLFKLTIDKIYNPVFKYNDNEYPFEVNEYNKDENIWELIGNINIK